MNNLLKALEEALSWIDDPTNPRGVNNDEDNVRHAADVMRAAIAEAGGRLPKYMSWCCEAEMTREQAAEEVCPNCRTVNCRVTVYLPSEIEQ